MRPHRLLLPTLIALACSAIQPAHAINIKIDYTYDTTNFFSSAQSRASIEAAASFLSSIIDDTFSPIIVPDPYPSSQPGSNGVMSWNWSRTFSHPVTGNPHTINNVNLPNNQYLIYVGARSFSGNTAGEGGYGGGSRGNSISGTNNFSASDIENMGAITANFFDSVDTRGQTDGGFTRWGGSVSFDNSSRTWHMNHTTAPLAGSTDLYSVAIHELGHALGLGTSQQWDNLISGGNFTGANARSWYSTTATVPTASGDHWAEGTMSLIYGTTTPQEASMDPSIVSGTRKRFTDLDAAALKDIGWDIDTLFGDYDASRSVDITDYVVWRMHNGQNRYLKNDQTLGTVANADYNVWRSNYGDDWSDPVGGASYQLTPEPSAAVLAIFAYIAASAARRKRRG